MNSLASFIAFSNSLGSVGTSAEEPVITLKSPSWVKKTKANLDR